MLCTKLINERDAVTRYDMVGSYHSLSVSAEFIFELLELAMAVNIKYSMAGIKHANVNPGKYVIFRKIELKWSLASLFPPLARNKCFPMLARKYTVIKSPTTIGM
jgi:hypothetical protein